VEVVERPFAPGPDKDEQASLYPDGNARDVKKSSRLVFKQVTNCGTICGEHALDDLKL
jgi:hypothetical protein